MFLEEHSETRKKKEAYKMLVLLASNWFESVINVIKGSLETHYYRLTHMYNTHYEQNLDAIQRTNYLFYNEGSVYGWYLRF